MQTFRSHSRPAPNPHGPVDDVAVSLVARLELDRQTEGVLARIDIACCLRVEQPLQHRSRTPPPSRRLDRDESGRLVGSPEQIVRRDVGV